MIPALIVCHGGLGDALLQAIEGIYGKPSHLGAISNSGLAADQLEAAILQRLAVFGGESCIIFTDYFGGSCASASLALVPRRAGVRVASGVNLPMLLFYLAHREELSLEELVQGILHRGQNAIRELKPPQL